MTDLEPENKPECKLQMYINYGTCNKSLRCKAKVIDILSDGKIKLEHISGDNIEQIIQYGGRIDFDSVFDAFVPGRKVKNEN